MLSCPVFVEMDPRQVFPSSNLSAVRLPHYPPKSFPLNSFADPHPLNRVASIFYKNIGGRETPSTFHSLSPIPYNLSPFFSHSCALFCTFLHSPKTQLSCFQSIAHSLHKNRGLGEESTRIQFPSKTGRLAANGANGKVEKAVAHRCARLFVLGGPPPTIFVGAQHAAP
jgi:hypothetical protein